MSGGQGSVTHWLAALQAGDSAAAQPLWERYFDRLVRLARRQIGVARRGGAEADEEDAALSAFDSFCRRAADGRFPRLDDRDDLWRLLVTLTACKAADQLRRRGRQKRGGGHILSEADLAGTADDPGGAGLERLVGREPTPEFAAMVAEQYRRLLGALGDETLRRVAVWRLEGYTGEEIAAKLGCARRTVVFRLELIRKIWQAEVP
jgi:DNA-directed RNA polymerase specialized sigma24 family protein